MSGALRFTREICSLVYIENKALQEKGGGSRHNTENARAIQDVQTNYTSSSIYDCASVDNSLVYNYIHCREALSLCRFTVQLSFHNVAACVNHNCVCMHALAVGADVHYITLNW